MSTCAPQTCDHVVSKLHSSMRAFSYQAKAFAFALPLAFPAAFGLGGSLASDGKQVDGLG